MPVLFSTSIYENIASGKDGATNADVIRAAKQANAHDFISEFPAGYETQCGDRLPSVAPVACDDAVAADHSCLAARSSAAALRFVAASTKVPFTRLQRALIKNPRVLLLDEASSNGICLHAVTAGRARARSIRRRRLWCRMHSITRARAAPPL